DATRYERAHAHAGRCAIAQRSSAARLYRLRLQLSPPRTRRLDSIMRWSLVGIERHLPRGQTFALRHQFIAQFVEHLALLQHDLVLLDDMAFEPSQSLFQMGDALRVFHDWCSRHARLRASCPTANC